MSARKTSSPPAAGVKLNSMMNVTLEPQSEEGKERETSAA